eukprot:TRINITY_DN1453_c0_g1_i1.p1 TRINITY_DN1453_c0_g1~~TRINITY_DN1453_c0_g1_i1.p1  ORF type:complete len:292 (+),score=88.27 TRINITY_DN1453_c0_g1_i1:124-876(+)
MRPRALPLAMLLASLQGAAAFHFQLEEGRPWCFIEDMRSARTLVHVSYRIWADFSPGEGVKFDVTSPRGANVFSEVISKREGQLQMTLEEVEGPYSFCASATSPTNAVRMSVDIETHVAGTGEWKEHVDPASGRKFYHNPKTKESLWELPKEANYVSTIKDKDKGKKGIATSKEDVDAHYKNMLAVQALMSQIKEESSYLRQRQQRFKITTETTADRVWWLSLFQIVISLVIPAVQTMQLKRMFVKKKLV